MNLALRLTVLALFASTTFAHDGDPKLLDTLPAYRGSGWRNSQRFAPNGTTLQATAPSPGFPASGVTLLSWLTLADLGAPGFTNGSMCWGYAAPSGREYALVGLGTGTVVVELTQPGNPVIVASIAGPSTHWRDVRTYQNYAYVVNDLFGGIQVLDLSNIDSGVVTLVATVNDDALGSTHTLTIERSSGLLFRSGGGPNGGLRIYDIATNPALPARIGTWSNVYCHETTVVKYTSGPAAGSTIAYICGGLSSGFTNTGIYTVDVTNPAAPTQLAYTGYPNSSFAHQVWPSSNQQWLYLNDENDDRNGLGSCVTRVFDLANPFAPSLNNTFTNGNTSTDHNFYVAGDKLVAANYRSGLRILQTSSPGTLTNPVEVAYFDTWPEDDGVQANGLWGAYPYLPSGIVFGSDREKGLFVWWVGTPQVTFSLPAGEPTSVPAAGDVLHVQVTGSLLAAPVMHVDSGSGFVSTSMTLDPSGDWLATLPAATCGEVLRFYFSAQSTNGVVWSDPPGAPTQTYIVPVAVDERVLYSTTWESGADGWTGGVAGDTATQGQWVRVDPIGTGLQPENNHTPGGTQCWVTGQTTSASTFDGPQDVDGGFTTLLSPAFALAGDQSARVSYWRWYDTWFWNGPVPNDIFTIDVSNNDGASWTNVESIGPGGADSSGGWIRHSFRVADFVTPTDAVRVRFVARDSNPDSGVEAAIDDFELTTPSCDGFAGFCFGEGLTGVCPCANNGQVGMGCANSVYASGGHLVGSGTASVAADSVVLNATTITGSTAIFFQGTSSHAPTVVDDGLGCVGGTIVRLGVQTVTSDASVYPDVGDLPISVAGSVSSAGQTLFYQCYYRNPDPVFCPPATTNRTNGVVVTWAP